MLFNSYLFILAFLPIMLIGYFWLLKKRFILGSKLWLVGGSLFFYGYWSVVYIPLLLLSIFVNFFVGSAFASEQKIKIPKKQLLIFGILFNVALLGYFKYTDFFISNFNSIFDANVPLSHIVLPLGISFFTFTQIAFLIDSYRNEVKEYNLLHYMLFVTYFPHLLAGPILHHKEMMPQFASRWNFAIRWRNVAVGLFLFSIGLFKKVVIADTFAEFANAGFDTATTLNFFEAWATSLSYTLQLYFDFSGYTDVAIGVSLMFNIILPINFNSPYKAKDIQDFWRRWHITLSRFLRDYVYIPLGGNKGKIYTFHLGLPRLKSRSDKNSHCEQSEAIHRIITIKPKNYLNLFTVFIIGGLWHGASWMFVVWGASHGTAIVLHRIWKDLGFKMWGWLGWLITFNFVNIAWVFFRAKELDDAVKVLGGMVGFGGIVLHDKLAGKLGFLSSFGVEFGSGWLSNAGLSGGKDLLLIAGMIFFVVVLKNSNELAKNLKPTIFIQIIIACVLALGILSLSKVSEFLYFQF